MGWVEDEVQIHCEDDDVEAASPHLSASVPSRTVVKTGSQNHKESRVNHHQSQTAHSDAELLH